MLKIEPEFLKKVIRCFIVICCFTALVHIRGIEDRAAQQQVLALWIIVIFSLLMRNIWLTLFIWWSVFLFVLFKFQIGQVYISNIFFGALLYYMTKLSFKKEHIPFFINAVLWLIALNAVHMCLQMFGLDFWYSTRVVSTTGVVQMITCFDPGGHMGFKACAGVLMALGVPLLATRESKWSILMACLLFVPIYLSKSSVCMAGGIVGLLFVLWFKMDKKWWVALLVGMGILGLGYVKFVDMPMGTFMDRIGLWKEVLHDCVVHPWQGWGLDSFRVITEQKEHLYAMNAQKIPGGMYFNVWDNPHNLYISLFFEWGIIGLLLLGGYLRDMCIQFKNRIKDNQTLALTGFVIVFFITSIAQFPMFLARCACFIIPAFALWELQICEDK